MNLASKLPATPLLLPSAALLLAALFLVSTLLLQGKAVRESALADAPPARAAAGDHDAPLPAAVPAASLGLLANSELFGHFDAARNAEASPEATASKPTAPVLGDKAPDALPEATLALKLQGIVYKQDPAQRRAIIAGDGPSPEARKIGETLLGDAVIRYIEARRVVVEQQGELRAINLLDPTINTGNASAPFAMPSMPGNAPSSLRRGEMDGAPQPQTYEPPAAEYEPPPEEMDNGAQYEEAPPDDATYLDQGEPAE